MGSVIGDQIGRPPIIGSEAVFSEGDLHITLPLLHRAFQPLVHPSEEADNIGLVVQVGLDTVLRYTECEVSVVVKDLGIPIG